MLHVHLLVVETDGLCPGGLHGLLGALCHAVDIHEEPLLSLL